MFKKIVLILATLALIATAGTVPSGPRYRLTLSQASVVQGTELKAGDYQVAVMDSKITIMNQDGKNPIDITAKVQTEAKKFDTTMVRFNTVDGKAIISEIRLGGSKTKLIFN